MSHRKTDILQTTLNKFKNFWLISTKSFHKIQISEYSWKTSQKHLHHIIDKAIFWHVPLRWFEDLGRVPNNLPYLSVLENWQYFQFLVLLMAKNSNSTKSVALVDFTILKYLDYLMSNYFFILLSIGNINQVYTWVYR